MRTLDARKFNKHSKVRDSGIVVDIDFTTAIKCLKEMYGEAALENINNIQAALDEAYQKRISPWKLRVA